MKLLAALDANPMVEYRILLLCDSDRGDQSPLDDLPDNMERLLHAGPEAVVLASGANRFYPDVRVEVWDEDPGPPDGRWEAQQEAGFGAPSTAVSLWGPPDECVGTVPVPAVQLRLRASCRGRATAARLVDESDDDVRGTEEWLLQLWPA